MPKIIIAMKDKFQSQKIAIVLSNSFDPVIVDKSTRLESIINSEIDDYYTIVFEDNAGEYEFTKTISTLRDMEKITFQTIQITSKALEPVMLEDNLLLEKPFCVNELVSALGSVCDPEAVS